MHVLVGGGEEQRERISSRLCDEYEAPSQDPEIIPEPKSRVRGLTNWAIQASRKI